MMLALRASSAVRMCFPAHAVNASHERSGFDQLSYAHHKAKLDLDLKAGAPDRNRTCNRRLRRPMLYPIELRAQLFEIIAPTSAARAANHHREFSHCFCSSQNGRGRGIRTLDIQLPKLALYQAELYPADNQQCALAVQAKSTRQPNLPQPATADYPLVPPEPHCPTTIKRVPKHPPQNWRARRDSNSRPPSS